MEKVLYFDMDGTIADLYGIENWLSKILSEDVSPYEEARPLQSNLQNHLLNLQKNGYKIGIVTWLAKGSTKEYDKRVRAVKREWLRENFPAIEWDEIHIVKYGTPKHQIVKYKNSLLFDDNREVRERWRGVAKDATDITQTLNELETAIA